MFRLLTIIFLVFLKEKGVINHQRVRSRTIEQQVTHQLLFRIP